MICQTSEQLKTLRAEQKHLLDSANKADLDKHKPSKSPKERLMEEIRLKSQAIKHHASALEKLQCIDIEVPHKKVEPGALVQTNTGYFLIVAVECTVEVAGNKVLGLSKKSPLYSVMNSLEKGAWFQLGAIHYEIINII